MLLISFGKIHSQAFVKGRVLDTLNAPLPYVPVALLQAKDSIIYKGIITNEDGIFYFDNILPGTYLVKITAAGFADAFSEPIKTDSISNLKIPDIIIKQQGVNLKEVSITAVKNPIEFKNGNVTVNIEGSPLAVGNTVYDLLSRLPGVTVIDNNISIQGTQGAKIFIDGRLQQLSGNQLVNLLKSMMAATIEKIEIMKNPSVKYDAAGGAGIINIKTKKLKIVGFSGNVNSTYTQAYWGNILGGLELNYKGKKINIFSSFSYVDESYKRINNFNRLITFNGLATKLDQTYIEREHSKFYTANLGADWFINSKNTVGFKISDLGGTGYYDRTGDITVSDTDLGYNYSSYGNHKENPFNYSNININAEHLFDTLGTKLIFSSDYSYNYDLYAGTYYNNYYDRANYTFTPPRVYKTDNRLDLKIISGKLDLEKQVSKTLKLETGLKATHQGMLSDFFFGNKNNSTGEYINDSTLTNIFQYNETITAAYLNLQKTIKKFNLQTGVRGENTSVNTLSRSNGAVFTRNYSNLFPVLSIDYNPGTKHSWQLSYNKRLERPDYNAFNPYRIFRNLLISDKGNPYLLPMYMSTINFSHNYKSSISNSISFTHIDNVFYAFTSQNDSTKESITSFYNLKSRDVLAYNLFLQRNPFKWWTSTVFASAIYFTFNGEINHTKYNQSSYSYYAGTNNLFLLSKKTKFELNAFYIAPWLEGIVTNGSRWNVDVAIRQSFCNDKLNLVIGCSDLFFTMIFRPSSDFGNLHWNARHTNDTRRARITLSYNFGKLKVQQREVKSNADESKRLGR